MAKFYYGITDPGGFPPEQPMAFTPVVWKLPSAHDTWHAPTGDYGVTTGHAAGLTGDLVFHAADGSVSRLAGVSRHALVGAGTVTLKAYWGGGNDYLAFGLDPSPELVGLGGIDHRVWDLYAGPSDNDTIVLTRDAGGNVTVTRNADPPITLGGVATQPLYLHVFINHYAASGVRCAVITGATNDTATPPGRPTLSVTPGYKRAHVAITYPAGSNGVSLYLATSSGGHDFTQPIATEVRLPYWEVTGLANGTTYYLRAKATMNGLAHSLASNEVTVTPAAEAVPVLSAARSIIIGAPTVKPIDLTDTNEYWYDRLNENETLRFGLITPTRYNVGDDSEGAPVAGAGTVAVANGARAVVGTGTNFLTEYGLGGLVRADTYIKITDGEATHRALRVYWVEDDTHLTLWDPYVGSTESGMTHRAWWHNTQDTNYWSGYLHYYSLPLSLYAAYYRTGSPLHLALARAHSDEWYEYAVANTNGETGQFAAPHMVNIDALCLRANDGKPEYWPDIVDWVTAHAGWLGLPYRTPRHQGYALMHYAFVAALHPGPATAASMYETARTNVLGFAKTWQDLYADHVPRLPNQIEFYIYDPDNHCNVFHYHQPFIDAIWFEMLMTVHRLAVLRNDSSYVEQLEAVFTDVMTPSRVTADFDERVMTNGGDLTGTNYVNACWYGLYHSTSTPYASPPPDPPPYDDPMDVIGQKANVEDYDTSHPGPIAYKADLYEDRLVACMTLTSLGYAYYLTGNTAFLTAGAKRIQATYGHATNSFPDVITVQCFDSLRRAGKECNESFRRSPVYLAYRDVIAPLGSP